MPGLQDEVKKRINHPMPAMLPLSDDTDTVFKNGNGNGHGHGKPAPPATYEVPSVTKGFVNQMDAPLCQVCGHVTVRNGACYKCLNCGESQGCS